MSARDYYQKSSPSPQYYNPYRRQKDNPPVLPPLPYENTGRRVRDEPPTLPPLPYETSRPDLGQHNGSPFAATFDSTPFYQSGQEQDSKYFRGDSASGYSRNESEDSYFNGKQARANPSRQYSDEIPLRDNPQPYGVEPKTPSPKGTPKGTPEPGELPPPASSDQRRRRRRRPRTPSPEPPRKFFSRQNTWVVYFFTLVQLTVFIAELVRNSILTGIPIEIHPQINPMLGPSFSVLVNMGARYVPCMKNVPDLAPDLAWPCPNTTSSSPTDPSNQCSIAELCGFQNFGNQPNQWWRFIAPIFLHAGIIHIGFNLLLQLTLGREIEQIIGSVRFLIVYLASGIFGFVLGGNFAAPGIESTGASGALFGMIAINLLDLLYTWQERVSPKKELAFIILDIVISFALGLLPGLDNFSHIGGFLMGLVLGVCILHTPNLLRLEKRRVVAESAQNSETAKRRRKRAKRVSYKTFTKDPAGFFKGRKALWWVWWFVRAGALLGVLVAFIVLLNSFYLNQNTCSWCRYLSCINVNNWCNLGQLPSSTTTTTAPTSSATPTSNALL